MKRVQNWRDYLDKEDTSWKEKFTKKKKFKQEDEERSPKKKAKRK